MTTSATTKNQVLHAERVHEKHTHAKLIYVTALLSIIITCVVHKRQADTVGNVSVVLARSRGERMPIRMANFCSPSYGYREKYA